ncbi:MAG: twitching motility protein PilT [Bdellovibrionia bacterium]
MSMTEMILQAKTQKATEALFVVGSLPKARILGEWTNLREKPVLISDWNVLTQTLLNPQQSAQLETLGVANGESLVGQQRVGFSFFQTDNTLRLLLNFAGDLNSSSELVAPFAIQESALNQNGLHLFLSNSPTVSTSTLSSVIAKINEEKAKVILVLSAGPIPQLKEKKSLIIYQQVRSHKDLLNEELYKSADVVVINGITNDHVLLTALQLAESGKSVILSVQSFSIMSYLRRAFSVLNEKYKAQGAPRLADCLQSIVGQSCGLTAQQEMFSAFEFMLLKPHIKQYLANEDMKSIEALLRGSAETSGVQTLNQSLLQLLVRRKIDVKTAFETSREPELLDQQLKKLGV